MPSVDALLKFFASRRRRSTPKTSNGPPYNEKAHETITIIRGTAFRAPEHLFQSEDAIELLAQLLEALERGLDESSDVIRDRVKGEEGFGQCWRDDEVIDEVDFEDRGGGLDGPSGVVIGQAGFGFSTWVIMSQDKCVGVWRRRQGVGPRVDERSTP